MLDVQPVTLEAEHLRLVPLSLAHVDGLQSAAADGELWNLRFTSVPKPAETQAYVEKKPCRVAEGHRLPLPCLRRPQRQAGAGLHQLSRHRPGD